MNTKNGPPPTSQNHCASVGGLAFHVLGPQHRLPRPSCPYSLVKESRIRDPQIFLFGKLIILT